MKRLLALLVLAGLIVAVPVGCGGDTKPTTPTKPAAPAGKPMDSGKPAPEKPK